MSLPALGQGEEYELRADSVRTYDPLHDAKVIGWRVECFEKLGIGALMANALAVRRDVDRVEVERLVKAGCPPKRIGDLLL